MMDVMVRALLAFFVLGLSVVARAEQSSPLFAASLLDLDGKPFTGEKLRGKPLVINFWARWCGPCKQEIPDLIEANAKFKERGVVTVGIGIEDRADSVREFAKAYEMDYLVLLAADSGLPLLRALGDESAGLPYTLVINRAGKVVARRLGIMNKADMKAAFELALQP